MSMDKSLRGKSSLARHRNVLTRAERIAKLTELEKWSAGSSALGMPKVGHRKPSIGKKVKKKGGEEEGAATTDTAKKADAGKKK